MAEGDTRSAEQADAETRARIIGILVSDKWQAHQTIFEHRHQHGGVPVEPAPFHKELISDFWSDDRYSIRMAFRGSAKSTLGEEDITLAACLRQFHNILVIGSSETRAAERLAAVAYELANNEYLTRLFGDLKGAVWTQTKLVTTGNVCIQAMGRDQDIRGVKYLDYRPDLVFVDDVESPESVQTPEQRIKTLRWFLAELLPACAPNVKVRIRATPMDAESVPMRLQRESGWPTKTYPVEYIDEAGKRQPSWPAAYPLTWIDRQRQNYAALGELGVWDREYMCKAVSDADTPFKREMIRVSPREKSWHACYAFIDPARTTGRNSASTGWAVWSWISNRLVVWAAGAQMLLPDEIVALAFDIHERFDPVWIGVELDGLEQWLLQPLRHEMARRGTSIPIRGLRAPRSKLDFIKGLQPYFHSRECEFAQPLPELTEQLLNFPRGRIDAPNALAYALQMRPGLPVYDAFNGAEHIVHDLDYDHTKPLFLAANATGAMTTAALVQLAEGRLLVLADWVMEGNPGECVDIIHREATLAGESVRAGIRPETRHWSDMLKQAAPMPYMRSRAPTWIYPPHHAERYTNVGLVQAIGTIPADRRMGGEEVRGQLQMRDLLGRTAGGMSLVQISGLASWTCRALSGGYSRSLVRGRIQDAAEEGPYRLLVEGIESFLALSHARREEEDADNQQPTGVDPFGRVYKTAVPMRN
jgi:hypothetical protein